MDHKHEEPADTAYDGGLMHPSDEHLDKNATRDEALRRMRTAGSISMSPELLEKLYLSPQNVVKGDLRKTFGNPTPIALAGFLISLFPLSCDLMGWRGAGGSGAASIGSYFFFGGLLMFLGGLLEWILGNAFPSVVFLTFSAFWLSFGATLVPDFHAYAAYAPADATSVAEGLQTRGFNASFGFFLLAMMLLCLVYLVCSLRTNVAFFIIFLTLVLGFGLLTGAYWALASDYTGNAAFANKLIKGGGACYFVTCLAGWWIFVAILLAILEFPFQLPVGDLSQLFAKKEVRNKSNV
ncbi:Protein alcS like protein [Verticillium longisporum]|nr:Protein alcS like protein [Verticillium longisporum]